MKIKGKEIKGRYRDFALIPRPDGDIVLWVEAIPNFEEFNRKCPMPKPNTYINAKGERIADVKNQAYNDSLMVWARRQTAWTVVKSLDVPENELEWDTVDLEKANTWENYQTELKASGFSPGEIEILLGKIFEVNALSEAKVESARQSFVRRLEALESDTTGQNSEQDSTKSGEPASGGE